MLGADAKSACVYGCFGDSASASAVPVSTTWPRYITSTRSLTYSITFRSCEMKMYVRLRSAFSSSEQVQHLRLHRLVERGHRLVQHEELRVEHQRPRDVHPLALAARQLVGIAATIQTGIQAYPAEQGARLLAGLDPAGAVREQAERHGVLDGEARVQRRVRILEDQLHVAAQALHPARQDAEHILAVEPHAAGVRLHQAEDQARQRRLAASRLAHDAQGLAPLHLERHVVHRAHPGLRAVEHSAAQGEVLAQAARLEQRASSRADLHGVPQPVRQ